MSGGAEMGSLRPMGELMLLAANRLDELSTVEDGAMLRQDIADHMLVQELRSRAETLKGKG